MRVSEEERAALGAHIEAQSRSGVTAKRYCDEQGLKYQSFLYQREVQRKAEKPSSTVGQFVALGAEERIEVRLTNGIELRVPASSIGRVLELLCARY